MGLTQQATAQRQARITDCGRADAGDAKLAIGAAAALKQRHRQRAETRKRSRNDTATSRLPMS